MINYSLEERIPPSPRPSYTIFVSMYRERYNSDEWPEEWSYRADCENCNNRRIRVDVTGKEAFARAVVTQLEHLTTFDILRKKPSALLVPRIKSCAKHSEQFALPDDEELAELEYLIKVEMQSKEDKSKEKIRNRISGLTVPD